MTTAHAQRAEFPSNARDGYTWMQAVMQHVPGQHDEAVAYVAGWATADLKELLSELEQLAPDEIVRFALVRRALVLHADVAMFNRTTTGYTLPPDGSPTDLFEDGKAAGKMYGTFHWEFGRLLLERLPRSDERQAMARTYYRAVGVVLQLRGEQVALKEHLATASGVTGNDPVLLLYEGTMHQAYADARAQRYFDELRETVGLVMPGPSGRVSAARAVPVTGPAAGQQLVAALRPVDEAGLITFTERVVVRSRPTSNAVTLTTVLGLSTPGRDTALVDAAYAAMVTAGEASGRPLVIVFNDGADTASFLPPDFVLDSTRVVGPVIYAVTTAGLDRGVFLDDLVRLTGGRRLEATFERLGETFTAILNESRERYLLSYSPEGVEAGGWHELTVRVRGRPDVEVRTRPGYLAAP